MYCDEYVESLQAELAECKRERDTHLRSWNRVVDENVRLREELAALRQELDDYAKDVLRLIETIKYLSGIAERGTGNECPPDTTVEQFVLGYVKQLESLRQKIDALEPVAWMANDGSAVHLSYWSDLDTPLFDLKGIKS